MEYSIKNSALVMLEITSVTHITQVKIIRPIDFSSPGRRPNYLIKLKADHKIYTTYIEYFSEYYM